MFANKAPIQAGILLMAVAWSFSVKAVDCETRVDNAILGCGIESTSELAQWDNQDFFDASLATGAGQNGNAMRLVSSEVQGNFLAAMNSSCFTVEPGQVVPMGYFVRLDSGVAPRCSVGYQQRADEACTTGAGGSLQTLDTSQVFPENSYSEVTGSHTIDRDDAVALELLISCRGSEPFVVFIDNAYAIAPQPVSPALPVPALNEAALLLLMLGLGFMGWRSFRNT